MAYEQGDVLTAWIPETNGVGGDYKTVVVVSTRQANRGKDVTVAVLTGQVGKSRRRPRDYILQHYEAANLDHAMAFRPKLFVILKGRIGTRIGRLHDDDLSGMLVSLAGVFGFD